MSLFGKKEKEEIARLRALLSPEHGEISDLSERIERNKLTLADIEKQIEQTSAILKEKQQQLGIVRQRLIETDERILLQEFGFYNPHYSYSTSDEYRMHLNEIREKQKELIKTNKAVSGNSNWTVNGSESKGKKMVSDMQKLLLRAFNAECDDVIEHVRFNNIDTAEKRILHSAEAISKLGKMMNIEITSKYSSLKIEELRLMHEYQVKKQEEKEALKEARQRQREEAKVQKELEEAKNKLEKEKSHYSNELKRLELQLSDAKDEESRAAILSKKTELEEYISGIDKQIEDVDYRAANHRAGFVYIISNIGAFGNDIYKIGMTRRVNPLERIDELGDASVPFDFDVHAMIFSEDAPALEAALHNAFADRKLNFVNLRREFFRVSLEEIKNVVRGNYDKTVEFVDVAPAEQYRQSLLLKGEKSNS